MKLSIILISLACAAACRSGPDGGAISDSARAGTDELTQIDAAPAICPDLSSGVVRCASLAPECQAMADPNVEAGLHCIAGYEAKLDVPCFCVGHTTPDSWCVRE